MALTNKGKGKIWQQKCLYVLSTITTSTTLVSMWRSSPTSSTSMSKKSLQISIRRSLSQALTWKCQTTWICCSAKRMAASSTKAICCAVPSTFLLNAKETVWCSKSSSKTAMERGTKRDMNIPNLGGNTKLTASRS